jgi:hypothetical protein
MRRWRLTIGDSGPDLAAYGLPIPKSNSPPRRRSVEIARQSVIRWLLKIAARYP